MNWLRRIDLTDFLKLVAIVLVACTVAQTAYFIVTGR